MAAFSHLLERGNPNCFRRLGFIKLLTGNLSGMSPRGFEVRVVLPLLLLKRAVVFDVKEIAPFDCPLGFRTCFLPLVSIVARTKAGKLRK